MNDENLVNIYDQSLSRILGNRKILPYKSIKLVKDYYNSNDWVNYYKCYSMTDVKIGEYIGYDIDDIDIDIDIDIDDINNPKKDSKLNYKTLTLLLGGKVYDEYIKRIEKAIEFLEFLGSDEAKKIIQSINDSRVRDHDRTTVHIAVDENVVNKIRDHLNKSKEKAKRKVNECCNKEMREKILAIIANNMNSAFAKLINLQDQFAPSGLKISIITTPHRSQHKNPILRSGSRYLEIENIEYLDVKIGKE